jgi:transposase
VAVLGASNYTYAEATRTQSRRDFIASHVRAFEYFGGVPHLLVPDQLKSAVTGASLYDPILQRTYQEMATHYGTAVMPARPAHPRDKAKVEVGVQVVQRWILARLRNQTFFSQDELGARIAELVAELNDRVMRVYGESRRSLFDRLDRPALLPLAAVRFVYGEWSCAKVNIDYHVDVGRHYYSVPHNLVGEKVEVRLTGGSVEVFFRGRRVASHLRSDARGRHTTDSAHMPLAHQRHLEWTPSRIVHWAGTVGLSTKALVEAILAERRHPEQGFRTCLGILRLGKRYGQERLEAACARAVRVNARSVRHVESILARGLDRVPSEPTDAVPAGVGYHENVRGGDYYH